MGWQVSLPEDDGENQPVHPAVARTMQHKVTAYTQFSFPTEFEFDLFQTLWNGYQDADQGSEAEKAFMNLMSEIDCEWDSYDHMWEPDPDMRELPSAYFERLREEGYDFSEHEAEEDQ